MTDLRTKYPSESRSFAFDFSAFDEVDAGASLSNPAVSATPSGLTLGTPVIVRPHVNIPISGGAAGTLYAVAVEVDATWGAVSRLRVEIRLALLYPLAGASAAPAAGDAPQTVTVYGTVRDLSGQPVDGVAVSLESDAPPHIRSLGVTRWPVEVATDAAGAFALEAMGGLSATLRIDQMGLRLSGVLPASGAISLAEIAEKWE